MFPVVDEHAFAKVYKQYRGCEQRMEPGDFMLYQAIIAAGFGVSGSKMDTDQPSVFHAQIC